MSENENEKRQRTNDEENTDSNLPQSKTAKVGDSVTNDNSDICCSICMDESQGLLPTHNCPNCKPSSWKVCESCDSHLLSRKCPFCLGEYKELMFYEVKGLPKRFPFPFSEITDPQERYIATIKTQIFCDIVLRSNCAVFSPNKNRMYFSLPKGETSSPTTTSNEETEFILASIPMSVDRMIDPTQFAFTNKIWDEIEQEAENTGNENETVIVPPKAALKWIIEHGINDTSVIMTPVTSETWNSLYDEIFSK